MEKVKVSKESAEAIEVHRRFNSDKFIVYKCIQAEEEGKEADIIPNIDVDTLIRALYIGYEVEQTPEENVRDYYELTKKKISKYLEKEPVDYTSVEAWKGERDGIRNTLIILNIKIKGVND